MAEEHGIDLIPHGWNTAIGVAADIHLMSSLPSAGFVEFNVGNELIEELVDSPFRLDAEGCLPCPDGPGLGINVNRERLKSLETSGFASPSWTWDDRMIFQASGKG